jgi:hypothetical protein
MSDGAGNIVVELVRKATDDARILVGELEKILAAEYPPEQRHGLRSTPSSNPISNSSWRACAAPPPAAAAWRCSAISPR